MFRDDVSEWDRECTNGHAYGEVGTFRNGSLESCGSRHGRIPFDEVPNITQIEEAVLRIAQQ